MFKALAVLVARYPRWVLGAWFAVSAVSLPFAARVGDVLSAQPEAPSQGMAAAVQALLASEFQGGEEVTLVAVAHGVSVHAGSPEYAAALDDVRTRLSAIQGTTAVRDYRAATGLDLLDEANDLSVLLIGLDASGLSEGKRVTQSVRAALDVPLEAISEYQLAERLHARFADRATLVATVAPVSPAERLYLDHLLYANNVVFRAGYKELLFGPRQRDASISA